MKFVILLFLVTAFPFTYFSQSTNCQDFRTGTFKKMDEDGPGSVIKRTEKYQIEKNKANGTKIKLSVEWIDDCTYTLKFIKGNSKWKKQHYPNPDKVLIVKIVETGSDYYALVAKFKGVDDFSYRSKFKVLK